MKLNENDLVGKYQTITYIEKRKVQIKKEERVILVVDKDESQIKKKNFYEYEIIWQGKSESNTWYSDTELLKFIKYLKVIKMIDQKIAIVSRCYQSH